MTQFRVIETLPLSDVHTISSLSNQTQLNVNSSAKSVVTDFSKKRPQLIEKDVAVDQALYMMKMGHVRSKIVIDKDERFLGIVSSSDLSSYKVLHMAQLRNVPRDDLTVENLMVSKEKLRAVSFDKVPHVSIGDILETLKDLGQQHVLLTDKNDEIRGLISATDIARALHVPININEKAHTFKDIFDVVFNQLEKQ